MRTINESTPCSFWASLDLKFRRYFPNMNTAAIKRNERRKARQFNKVSADDAFEEWVSDRDWADKALKPKVASQAAAKQELPVPSRAVNTRVITVVRKLKGIRRPVIDQVAIPA